LRLDSLDYSTPANPTANVGAYFIRPALHRPLNNTDPVDLGLKESYNFIMNDGILSVEKMPLLITPRDTTLVYGDKIGQFAFNYSYPDSNIATLDKARFLDSIETIHHSDLIDTVIGLVNGLAITGRSFRC
jgi:hypothetical protein